MCKQTSLAPTLVCPLSISPSVRLSDFHSNSLKVLTNRLYKIVVADMMKTSWPTKKNIARHGGRHGGVYGGRHGVGQCGRQKNRH